MALLFVTLEAPEGNAIKLSSSVQLDSKFGLYDPTIVTLENVNAVK